MSIQLQGYSGTVPEVDGKRAVYHTARPLDTVSTGYGTYSIAVTTGTMAAGIAGGSEFCQFRWTSATVAALIRRVRLDAMALDTAFTAGQCIWSMTAARSFSAAGTGGGAATITTNNGKMRTSMATTGLGEIRIATTAALGTGTKTLDAQPLTRALLGIANTAWLDIAPRSDLFNAYQNKYPLYLAQNEGFALITTVPATGTWSAAVTIEWEEVPVTGTGSF